MIVWDTHLFIRSEQYSIDPMLTADSRCINDVVIKNGVWS